MDAEGYISGTHLVFVRYIAAFIYMSFAIRTYQLEWKLLVRLAELQP